MLISGTLARRVRMTDMAQPLSTWSLILQQTSQDLFPGWYLQSSQEDHKRQVPKHCYFSILCWYPICYYLANQSKSHGYLQLQKWKNRLLLDRQTFKIIFQRAQGMGWAKFIDIFNISDNLIIFF